MSHPMLPGTTHDEAAEQLFVRDLKTWLADEIEPHGRALAARLDPGPGSTARAETVYEALHHDSAFRSWASLRRASQEMLWDGVAASVGRQRARLEELAASAPALGSLTLDPDFAQPAYHADRDVHIMPGGYGLDDGGVGQGAVMDRGGAVYMLGRNGGLMNDGRGQTILAHLAACYPDFAPARILELGCGVGASIVPVAQAFPAARSDAIDLGASMLRYAHARASHLGVGIHFAQGDAERAPYDDAAFDLVFSCTLFHETSAAAIPRILAESRRLLRPGGIAVHLEVPQRFESMDLWGKIRGQIEADYNNEPAWREATSADFAPLMRQAGFAEILVGYQDAAEAAPAQGGFTAESKGVFRSWFVTSGRA